MSHVMLRPLSFGEVLDGAFKLYRRHFVVVFATAIVSIAPMMLLMGPFAARMATMDESAAFDAAAFGGFMLAMVAAFLFFALMYGALTRLFSQGYAGGEVSVGDAYRAGLRSFLPVLASWAAIFVGWMVVVFAGILIVGIAAALVAVVASAAGAGAGAVVGIAVGVVFGVVGAAVGIVMYAALMALWMGVLPAIVVERLGPLAAIGRWVRLARGAFWRVIAMAIVTFMLMLLPSLGIFALTGVFTGNWTGGAAGMPAMVFWIQQLFSAIVSAITYPFVVAAFVLLYYDRRVRVEALDVEMAAEGLNASHATV
jgi:hypothetical protein